MTTHPPTAAVRKSFSDAQAQAAAMVAGPPTPWNEATRAQRKSPLWIGVAALAVVAGGVAGWVSMERFGATEPAGPQAASGTLAPIIVAPAPPAPVPQPTFTTVTAPPSLSVTRQGGVIRIVATHAPLGQAVRALADATRTRVRGGEALASLAVPVTLNWQGRDTAAAWDALLSRFASTALSCTSTGCELWIAGINLPRAAGTSATGQAAPIESMSAPAAVNARPPQPQPQSSDENTETN